MLNTADKVEILLGGNHRTDWVSTYPFAAMRGLWPDLDAPEAYHATRGDVVVLLQGGCASVVTTAGESTAHRINVMHDLGANSAAILSGLAEASASKHITNALSLNIVNCCPEAPATIPVTKLFVRGLALIAPTEAPIPDGDQFA